MRELSISHKPQGAGFNTLLDVTLSGLRIDGAGTMGGVFFSALDSSGSVLTIKASAQAAAACCAWWGPPVRSPGAYKLLLGWAFGQQKPIATLSSCFPLRCRQCCTGRGLHQRHHRRRHTFRLWWGRRVDRGRCQDHGRGWEQRPLPNIKSACKGMHLSCRLVAALNVCAGVPHAQ